MFHRASESGPGAGKLAARPTEPAARVCRRSRPIENVAVNVAVNVSGPDFSRTTGIALRVRTDDSRVGDVEIRREMLDKTTCPVPVPCPVPALSGNHVRSRARSASPQRTRVQRSPWSTRAGLLLSLEGRASQSAAKHVAIFIQPQNGVLNKIDFLRGRSRVRLSHGQKCGDEIAEHCEKPRQGRHSDGHAAKARGSRCRGGQKPPNGGDTLLSKGLTPRCHAHGPAWACLQPSGGTRQRGLMDAEQPDYWHVFVRRRVLGHAHSNSWACLPALMSTACIQVRSPWQHSGGDLRAPDRTAPALFRELHPPQAALVPHQS